MPKLRSAVEAAGEKGLYYVEFRVTHPDGSVHWIAGKGEVTKDESGRARRVAGVYYEISERKALEARLLALNEGLEARVADRARQLATTAAQLEETEHRFQLLIDAVTDYAIFMLDKTGHVVSWNPGARADQGIFIGRNSRPALLALLYRERSPEGSAPDRARDRRADRKIRSRRIGAFGKTAPPFSRMSSSTLFAIAPGICSGSAKITRDITEKKSDRRTTSSGPKNGGGWTTDRRGCSRFQ